MIIPTRGDPKEPATYYGIEPKTVGWAVEQACMACFQGIASATWTLWRRNNGTSISLCDPCQGVLREQLKPSAPSADPAQFQGRTD